MTRIKRDKDGNIIERKKWKPWKKIKVLPKETTPLVIVNSESSDFESNEPETSLEFVIDDIKLNEARNLLYASHVFAKFAEMGWQFCVILFLTAIANYKSIIFVSTYGLFCGVTSCVFGSTFGGFIDSKQYDRLFIAKSFIFCENLSVLAASLSCFFLLKEMALNFDNEGDTSKGSSYFFSRFFRDVVLPLDVKNWSLLAAIHIFGAFAKLLDDGFTVCIEMDWIVVMSKCQEFEVGVVEYGDGGLGMDDNQSTVSALTNFSDLKTVGPKIDDHIIRDLKEKSWLAQTNTTLRQIDLASKILAPAAAGVFISFFDSRNDSSDEPIGSRLAYAAMIIGLLNFVSLFVEYFCAKKIYESIPTLSHRGQDDSSGDVGNMPKINDDESMESDTSDNTDIERCTFCPCPRGLALYFKQPISLAGISLALLYLNVLSFGAIMTAYLVSKGMSFNAIGFWRGMSSFIGLCGTVAFHISESNMGLFATGMWSVIMQLACLSICLISLFLPNVGVSLFLLIFGVCVSRIGLISFDLATTQLMQQHVPENIRGTVGGVQKSLNSFFELGTYVLGFIFPNIGDFYILVTTGVIAVSLAMCCYWFGVYRRQASFKLL